MRTDTPIQQKLHEIGEYFLSDYLTNQYQRSYSLLGGRSGSILIQLLFYKQTGNSAFKTEAEKNLDYIFEKIAQDENPLPTFCTGLAGVGWLLNYIHDSRLISFNLSEILEDVNIFLEDELDKALAEDYFDLLHGAMGIGLYHLKTGNSKAAEKIIARLSATCERDTTEIRFQRYDPYITQCNIYDLGLAHGNAGILYFLGKCYQQNIQADTCRELISGIIRFYFNNTQDPAIAGSYYPNVIIREQYGNTILPSFSRLGWCYGDLGALYAIYMVAGWINDAGSQQKALEMLLHTSIRTQKPATNINDSQFCHGTSGTGYIYLQLYNQSQHPVFKTAHEFWLAETLKNSHHSEGVSGYLFDMGSTGLTPMTDILSGLGGVALYLLSAVTNTNNNNWDECLFLS